MTNRDKDFEIMLVLVLTVFLWWIVAPREVSAQQPPRWHVGDWWTLRVLTMAPNHEWCEPTVLHYVVVDTATVDRGTVFRQCYRVEEYLLEEPDARDPLPPASWVFYFATSYPALIAAADGVGPKGYPCRDQADAFQAGSQELVAGPHMILIPTFEASGDSATMTAEKSRKTRLRPAYEPAFVQQVQRLGSEALEPDWIECSVSSRLPASGYSHITMLSRDSAMKRADSYWHPELPWAVYSEFFNRDRPDEVVQRVWLVDWHVHETECK